MQGDWRVGLVIGCFSSLIGVVTACSMLQPTATQQSFCATVQSPILIDKKDVLTDTTLRRIVGINETGVRLCGWKKP